jgi:hypothetical protein
MTDIERDWNYRLYGLIAIPNEHVPRNPDNTSKPIIPKLNLSASTYHDNIFSI